MRPAFAVNPNLLDYIQSDGQKIPVIYNSEGYLSFNPSSHVTINLPFLAGKIRKIDTQIGLNSELEKYFSASSIGLTSQDNGKFCFDPGATFKLPVPAHLSYFTKVDFISLNKDANGFSVRLDASIDLDRLSERQFPAPLHGPTAKK